MPIAAWSFQYIIKCKYFVFQVARGNCFVRLTREKDGGSNECGVVCIVHGLKKFTGGLGDDDDRQAAGTNQAWKNYFTKVMLQTKIFTK